MKKLLKSIVKKWKGINRSEKDRKEIKCIKRDRDEIGMLGLCPTSDMHIWVRAVTKGVANEEFCMRCCKINFKSERIDLSKLLNNRSMG